MAVAIILMCLLSSALCKDMKAYNQFHVVFQIAYVQMLIRVVLGPLNNLGILPVPINLPFAPTERGIVFDSFIVALLLCYGIWNRYKLYHYCADSHVALWKEEKFWEELFKDDFEECEDWEIFWDDEADENWYLESEERWKEIEDSLRERTGSKYKRKLRDLKRTLKESTSLKVVSIVGGVLLFFSMWNGILQYLDRTYKDVDYYYALEETYYDKQFYHEEVNEEPSDEDLFNDNSGFYI